MKKSILPLCLLLTLASCGKGSGGSSSSQTNNLEVEPEYDISATVERTVKINQDLSNFEEFKKNMNSFVIKFQDKTKSAKNAAITCFEIHSEKERMLTANFDAAGKFAYFPITIAEDDGLEVKFQCEIRTPDHRTTIGVFYPVVQRTLYIDKPTHLKELGFENTGSQKEINSLVLDKDGVLLTGDWNTDLKIEELISLKGAIKNNEKGTKSKSSYPFYAELKIFTQVALGELNIEMRGVKGKDHPAAAEYLDHMVPDFSPSLNGKPTSVFTCQGREGAQGFSGANGSEGNPGVDSGRLLFEVMKISNLRLVVTLVAGAGGDGQIGGKGGKGGQGGKGSEVNGQKCADGATGKDGVKGRDGVAGAKGKIIEPTVVFHTNIGPSSYSRKIIAEE